MTDADWKKGPVQGYRPVLRSGSAHAIGVLWFTNLCSPYIDVALGRPSVPSFVYVSIGLVAVVFILREGARRFQVSWLTLLGGIYLFYAILLTLLVGTHYGGYGFATQGLSVVAAMCLFRQDVEYRIVFRWVVAGMAGLGLFMIWQSVTGYLPPWAVNQSIQYAGDFARAGYGFGEKNYTSALLVVGLIFGLYAMFSGWIRRWVGWIAIAMCLAGIVGTFSRGAIVALCAALLCYALTSPRRFARSLVGAAIATPVVAIVFASFLDLILSRFEIIGRDPQALSRVDQISQGLSAFLSEAGQSLTASFFGLGGNARFGDYANIVHNTPIGILVEQGVFGLTLWLIVLAHVVWVCSRLMARGNVYPLMTFVAFICAALLIRIEVTQHFWLLLLFVQGCVCVAGNVRVQRAEFVREQRSNQVYD